MLAQRFMLEHPEHKIMSTRQKALALNRWLRAQNLMGMENETVNYHNLRNCLLGHALSDDEHPSLPIISSAIFASVAERLGMSSACCAFPSHVHASVKAPPGMTLDGDVEEDPKAEPETMYLNPYKWDGEVTLDELRRALVELGWTQGSEVFLRASPVPIIVLRTAANIKAATSRIQNLADRSGEPIEVEAKRLRAGHPDINVEAAKYASMWAELMVKPVSSVHWDHNLETFLHSFAMSWGEDAWIVRKYLLPMYEQFVASQPHMRNRAGWENVREILNMLDNLDRREAVVTRRYTQEMQERVRYRIGQVFRHKRYGWIGIINGWAAGSAGLPVPHYLDGYEDEVQSPTTSPRSSGDRLHSEGQLRPQLARVFYTCMYVWPCRPLGFLPSFLFDCLSYCQLPLTLGVTTGVLRDLGLTACGWLRIASRLSPILTSFPNRSSSWRASISSGLTEKPALSYRTLRNRTPTTRSLWVNLFSDLWILQRR